MNNESGGDRPSLYLACKLTGASRDHIDLVRDLIERLSLYFEVLPFQYDFKTYRPTGVRQDVLKLDLDKVEQADIMVVILNDDVSDGRGMEVMHRMHQSYNQAKMTIILHRTPLDAVSPMYTGLPYLYPGVTLKKFDQFSRIERLVLDWVRAACAEAVV
jgi:hypothetical protein